ncbi:MAG: SAM-dependent methyltransferase [Prevotella sp.]|nr:SAM-dependent methyltransferase [Prevotella sp.]
MNQATLDFIREHAEADVRQLALRKAKNPEVDLMVALEQIAGRQKARTKIPSWAAREGMIYPPHLSMEQCSSEQTARYKAGVAGKGTLFVDLTAGFGVDTAFIAEGFQRVVSVERQEQLCQIAFQNHRLLGLQQIEVVCGDGVVYLHQMQHADLLFIDPARRDAHGGRTYGISDCEPNVLEIIDEMVEKADRVMLKLSPMLDWRKAVEDLQTGNGNPVFVNEVHIVSVDNECKELLLIVSKEEKPLHVFCVNNGDMFDYEAVQDRQPVICFQFSAPCFLYEPNASLMKAGCFGLMTERYPLAQLDVNSHLFVSASEIPYFPGRRFVVENVTSMNKRELKQALAGIRKANIAVRNFPLSVADLRKRLNLQDGGDVFIFATTVANQGHQLVICRKKP